MTRPSATDDPQAAPGTAVEHITLCTPIGRACGGSPTRYALDHVRALAAGDHVILQATDGHQAVCLIARGRLRSTHLLPPRILPTRRVRTEVTLRRGREGWISTEGRLAEADPDSAAKPYPPVAQTLPAVATRPAYETAAQAQQRTGKGGPPNMHIALGIDIDVLRKLAEGLGSTKLTLLVPIPIRPPRPPGQRADQVCVDRPIAACPLDPDSGVEGIGVIMPIRTERAAAQYEKLRQRILQAEQGLDKAASRNGRKTAAAS